MKSDDVRNRLGWVALGLAVFVLTVHISMPGVNKDVWNALLSRGELFQFLGMFTGGALNNFSVAAMGITPYINASIIMQLLGSVLPQLKEMQKEGEIGRRQVQQYTRNLTVALATLQATFMTFSLARYAGSSGQGVFTMQGFGFYVMVIIAMVAGTSFLMWLGELMTERGIGNGISMLIFAGIVLRFPNYLISSFEKANVQGATYWFSLILFLVIMVALVMGIIFIHLGVRKVAVQYPKRQVGNKMYGGHSSYLPLRVNNAGVISIIFAISIMYIPRTIVQLFIGFGEPSEQLQHMVQTFDTWFNPSGILYNVCYALLVIFFTYFYSAITFNVKDVAENLKKSGGFIPGIRPGVPTAEYLDRLFSRLTFVSAIFLAFIAVAPTYIMQLTGVNTFFLGSTSLLIIVGVALDTMQQIQARLIQRHYHGFMK
ncbi:preprotein translocase subunit SecY [bacterium]|nr:preprotein translocase subunit SecY [bacterium]